jgi:DNA mismatch repair protein MutS
MGYTPMIEQYLKIKAEYKDSFLFFRLGDFYEMFFEDAVKAAQELEITLTKKNAGKDEKIPMCGVPHHSAENYIKVLIEKGYKVAICEQVEDPKTAKGVVKREVVQVITPGTVIEGAMLKEQENNYLAAVTLLEDSLYGFSYADMSTGEIFAMEIENSWQAVLSEIYNRPIREIVIDENLSDSEINDLKIRMQLTVSLPAEYSKFPEDMNHLLDNVNQSHLLPICQQLLMYLFHTQKRAFNHLKKVQVIQLKQYMNLDMYSKRNLEITHSMMRNEKFGSLLWVLDKTITAMGARKMKKWLERPLLRRDHIENRLEIVTGFYNQFMERENIRESLRLVYDLERLCGRVSFGNVNGRDLLQLKKSLQQIPQIKEGLEIFDNTAIHQLAQRVIVIPDLLELLESSIAENPPISINEGNLLKDGYNQSLDQYRHISRNGKSWIAELEQKEKEQTGIKSLKIGFNKVFGYYIEVTRANLHLIPTDRYERKQTLANAERYITNELKEKEELILEAEEKSVGLEYELFVALREEIKNFIPQLQNLADILSEIDVLQSFATVSEENNYVKPNFSSDGQTVLKEGRHPVIEKVMSGDTFVPNDVALDNQQFMLLITGPNMSGKSTYMRQLALTIVMAQVGCFVPAKEATLAIFDQIFTRIGAADDLVSGQSTFMVEMLEANNALQNATSNSLILLDEIGRGTSTYDGMALAQAIMEYIHHQIHAKTLFSTHYHELTTLDQELHGMKNIHVKAEEVDGKVVFLHQIREGAADESYGIHVAQLAGLPSHLISRAKIILDEFELKSKEVSNTNELPSNCKEEQISFFSEEIEPKNKQTPKQLNELVELLYSMNVLDMTPMEAMNHLYTLQKKAKGLKGRS